jgi:hypothetical protein
VGGKGGGREREKERQRGVKKSGQTLVVLETIHNPPPLSCYVLQCEELLEWVKRAGEFSDESDTGMKEGRQKRFEPRCPTSKEDLLALTALRLNGCNLSGDQRRETNTLALFFRLHLHSELVFGQFFQLRAREHCLLSHPCYR